MDTPTLLAQLKAMEPGLRESGIAALYLFGSRARGDHRPDSDVDLLCEVGRERFSYFDLFSIRADIADSLRLPIELVERQALHEMVRPYVEPDLVKVF